MVARLENFLRNTVRTYRVTLADLTTSTAGSTSGAQIYFELIGAPNKKVKLRHFQNFKPTGAHQFRLAQYSVATTGSTGITSVSPTRISGSGDSTFGGTVRFYTVGPPSGSGTLLNQGYILDQDLSTGDVVNEHFGDEKGIACPELISTAESFAGEVTSSNAVILNGYLEFTEEP